MTVAPPAQLAGMPTGQRDGSRTLVVLGGLPGAGKTTLLRQLVRGRPAGTTALDAEDVAAAVRSGGVHLPYRALRPLVHAVHLARVVRASATATGCVLTTDPLTSPLRRAALVLAAQCTGRRLHVVLLDTGAREAALGQLRRGRALGRRRMSRHVRRWERLHRRLERTGRLGLVGSVVVSRTGGPARTLPADRPRPVAA